MERANRTLQDRLVKEMRLRGIDGMEAGNAYLGEFMADFNRRFAVAPRNPADAHRAVLHDAAELDLILCEQHGRKLTKNLTIRFECREYPVTGRGKGYRLRGAEVTVCKAFDGAVTVLRDGRELSVRQLAQGEEAAPVEDGKTVVHRVEQAKAEQLSRPAYKPPPRAWRLEEDEAASAGRRREFVDESCGPARALRGVWTAGGKRSAEWSSTGRFAARCPPAAHTRAPLDHNPTASATRFSSRKRGKARTAKRGHFCFALTKLAKSVDGCYPVVVRVGLARLSRATPMCLIVLLVRVSRLDVGLRRCLLLALALLVAGAPVAAGADRLFSSVQSPAQDDIGPPFQQALSTTVRGGAELRVRRAQVLFESLHAARAAYLRDPGQGGSLELNLFEDVGFKAVVLRSAPLAVRR